jgi:ribosome maturation factor RimP
MNDPFVKKINDIIEAPIKSLGFEVVQISFKGGDDYKTLEVLIENPLGTPIAIEDCKKVSKNIGVILDVEELIKDQYKLEVSSAGLERPLIKLADYERFLNHDAKIKLKQSLNNASNYNGKIIKVVDDQIYLNSQGQEITIPFDMIKNARLLLTDERFKEILKSK